MFKNGFLTCHHDSEIWPYFTSHEETSLAFHLAAHKIQGSSSHGLAPSYLSDLLKYRKDRGSRNEKHHLLIDPKITRVTFGGRSFMKAYPVLWNPVPVKLQQSWSLEVLRHTFVTRCTTATTASYWYNVLLRHIYWLLIIIRFMFWHTMSILFISLCF